MMGLLSTIRGKKDGPVLGSTDVTPIAQRSKKTVIQEWPKLLEEKPDLFKEVWMRSATRSTSIKQAFGISESAPPESSPSFMALHSTIEAFFYNLIVECQLDDDKVQEKCEQLGRRHVDFISRGFHSNYWDIFLVCMAETIDETLSSYLTEDSGKTEMLSAWQRVINNIVFHMRKGYNERRREELKKGENGSQSP